MKSINVCVIDIDTIKITIIIGLVIFRKKASKDNKIAPTRFICIPGTKPVKVPMVIPSNIANINSNIIHLSDILGLNIILLL